jgi:hypothetical protein
MTPAQVKIAIQMGSVYGKSDGLVGAGAGSVNFQSSMKVADNGLLTSLLGTVTSVLGLSSGVAFHDTSTGTLINRIYDRTGVRLLSLLERPILFGSANGGEPGVLNLLGLGNPIGSVAPNYVVWGDMAGWTSSYYVVWGDSLQSPSGQYVVWGDSIDDGDYVVWGNSLDPGRRQR